MATTKKNMMTDEAKLTEMYKALGELHKAGNDKGYNLLWDKIWSYELPMVPRKW